MERKDMYSTTQAAKLIGVKPHQLKYAIESGMVEDVTTTFAGKRVFNTQDIERIKKYFDDKMGGHNEV